MTLPYPIPPERPYPFEVGEGTGFELGWPVWAIQRAINRFHQSWTDIAPEETPTIPMLVDEDFRWSPACTDAITIVQHLLRLVPDGVAGYATQRRLVKFFTGDVTWLVPSHNVYRHRYGQLPAGLLHSISHGEMSYLLGGVSYNEPTNIDLGPFQNNVRGDALEDFHTVSSSFDVRVQVQRKADELAAWHKDNHSRLGCSPPTVPKIDWPERIWRRAAMAHNRPLDAAVLARFTVDQLDSTESRAFERQWVGRLDWTPQPWNEPLQWVLDRGCKIDAARYPIRTRLDWARFYALGFPTKGWPGLVTRYVRSWAPQAP